MLFQTYTFVYVKSKTENINTKKMNSKKSKSIQIKGAKSEKNLELVYRFYRLRDRLQISDVEGATDKLFEMMLDKFEASLDNEVRAKSVPTLDYCIDCIINQESIDLETFMKSMKKIVDNEKFETKKALISSVLDKINAKIAKNELEITVSLLNKPYSRGGFSFSKKIALQAWLSRKNDIENHYKNVFPEKYEKFREIVNKNIEALKSL